jgi:hypothetical protein
MAIAINGSGTVTGISVGGLPDGIVDTDMLAANAVTAAKTTVAGITMADQWRLNTDLQLTQTTAVNITANWERADTYGFGQLGTGMTESSGIFTFPSTGIYLIRFQGSTYTGSGASVQNRIRITTTTDNSNYNTVSTGFFSHYGSAVSSSGSAETQFDVTNTSTHKVRFQYYTQGSDVKFITDTTRNITFATFIRLGDT